MQGVKIILVATVLMSMVGLFMYGMWIETHKKEVIRVGLEPFPPLINEDGSGYSIDLLKRIEKVSNLQFDISIMPYYRAKNNLEKLRLDLIGHTPYQLEEKPFYRFAQELDWSKPTYTDLYAKKTGMFQPGALKNTKRIGVPRGNEGFFSELLDIPEENFIAGSDMDSLLKMLDRNEINAFIFERASTMSSLQRLGIAGIRYRKLKEIPIGFAVRKDQQGADLKKRLERHLSDIDQGGIYRVYLSYTRLPESGVVQVQ